MDRVPSRPLWQAIERWRAREGLEWVTVASRLGFCYSGDLLKIKRSRTIPAAEAERILRALVGEPRPPSRYERSRRPWR